MSLNKALEAGCRLIDTAYGYSNEHIIGKVLHEWLSSGKVTRDELFIVTKVYTVVPGRRERLQRLKV